LTPRALFAPNGDTLPCTDKSKLIHLLVKLAKADTTDKNEMSRLVFRPWTQQFYVCKLLLWHSEIYLSCFVIYLCISV